MDEITVRRRKVKADTATKADAPAAPKDDAPHPPLPPTKARKRSRMATCMRRATCFVFLVVLVAAMVAVPVLVSIFHGPKPADEMWDDWKNYAAWQLVRATGRTPPCTYAGVRFYKWGQGVDAPESSCDCWLHRCPPSVTSGAKIAVGTLGASPSSKDVQVAIAPEQKNGPVVTVGSIRDMCHNEPAYTPREDLAAAVRAAWLATSKSGRGASGATRKEKASPPGWIVNPLFHTIRFPGSGAVPEGSHIFATVPTCVQAGRVYFDMPAPEKKLMTRGELSIPTNPQKPIWEEDDSEVEADDAAMEAAEEGMERFNAFVRGELELDDSPLLSQFEVKAGTHTDSPHLLTDFVLHRAAKYHPITVVRALGLLINGPTATTSLDDLIRSTLSPADYLFDALAELEKAAADGTLDTTQADVNGSTSPQRQWVPFAGWTPEATRSWLHSARQALFMEDVPDLESIVQPTVASSRVARELGNSFSFNPSPSSSSSSLSSSSPPSASTLFGTAPVSRIRYGEKSREPMYCFCQSLMMPQMEPLSRSEVDTRGFPVLRHRLNTFFGALPLSDEVAANTIVSEAARRAAHGSMAARFWPSTSKTTTSSSAYTPRLVYISREDRRVAEEARLLALLEQTGFDVTVVTVDADELATPPMSGAEWFHVGRYADVVMGSHGPSLTHAIWMDNARRSCRTVVELLPFGQADVVRDVLNASVSAAGIRYASVEAVDVRFGSAGLLTPSKFLLAREARRGGASEIAASQTRTSKKKKALRAQQEAAAAAKLASRDGARVEYDLSCEDETMRVRVKEARRQLSESVFGPFEMPAFLDQTALYDWSELEQLVKRVYTEVTTCLLA